MAPRTRRHRRPATTALAALAAATLAIPLLSACGAVEKAMDCAKTATSVVNAVDKLQQAADNSLTDPQKAEQALDNIDTNLKKLSKDAHDPELSKAIDKTNNGIKAARKDLDNNKAPDIQPIVDGTSAMTKICTPG
ncbi:MULTISPECIES: hypothetical protein [Streptomyces]|uniref:hypothetical protein n=1 Tax=Streptomyces TaxID=1883 RepID=UPI0004C88309|nr:MULTISPECIES: hypothetical protein [Streptomyces]MCL7491343.1 hypothetical protein [Streptomyces sp. MCA2]BDH09894.1 hypothetical protein HOK021_10730 [Streptomyces hygroscopicus]